MGLINNRMNTFFFSKGLPIKGKEKTQWIVERRDLTTKVFFEDEGTWVFLTLYEKDLN